jgi:hypothetical protein
MDAWLAGQSTIWSGTGQYWLMFVDIAILVLIGTSLWRRF